MISYKKLYNTVVCALAFVSLYSCGGGEYQKDTGIVWNTTYSITYQSAENLSDSILTVMRQVELSLSPFNSASLITAINRGKTDSVDVLIKKVFDKSVEINAVSEGLFDPTAAPLINLWGFGYKKQEITEPTSEQIDSALMSVGIADCKIEKGRIVKKSPVTEFNFSAITKGYGCDLVGEKLQENGVENYMVEIGGELSLKGNSPMGRPWRIQIDAPVFDNTVIKHERLAVVEVTDCGVATSGNYRNYKTGNNGKKIGHTISPKSGEPIMNLKTLSATVIAKDCLTADALATACMTMPAEDALKMISSVDGASCLIVVAKEDDNFEIIKSDLFPDFIM